MEENFTWNYYDAFGHGEMEVLCWFNFVMACAINMTHMKWLKIREENARVWRDEEFGQPLMNGLNLVHMSMG